MKRAVSPALRAKFTAISFDGDNGSVPTERTPHRDVPRLEPE